MRPRLVISAPMSFGEFSSPPHSARETVSTISSPASQS